MAAKAKLLRDTIRGTLKQDTEKNGELAKQLKAFKNILIHDLTEEKFADIYAQTIVYGMFAARLQDKTPDDFSRTEAATLIPETNPFLRKIFQNIAGFDMDDNITWITDSLVESFRVTDMHKVMKNFGATKGRRDPLIHFYEDFLGLYDPDLKKSCGVFYTPEPVVEFIVNSVDEILRGTFDLPMGLADTGKVKVPIPTQNRDKKGNEQFVDEEFHRVQLLDPATGTATFPAKIIQKIYGCMEKNRGGWQDYVDKHLLPRINGFEFMMAPYAVAHLKLNMVLSETGYVPRKDNRLRIFLTNSLEESHPDTGTLFAQWLAQEASEANHIKRYAPVMVMLGNPPYQGSSSNKGKWIKRLIEDYKYTNGEYFKERKHPLQDDYVKFIRLGQAYVERTGSGILAYVNNYGFLNNPTCRSMRWNLLRAFDEIYVLNLHGDLKETPPVGEKNENVFDIKIGVSINIFIKTGKKKPEDLGRVFYRDIWGTRENKYDFLHSHSMTTIEYEELAPSHPFYFFVPQISEEPEKLAYEEGFDIKELFLLRTMCCVSSPDPVNISFTEKEQREKIADLLNMPEQEWRLKYHREKDSRDWTFLTARDDAKKHPDCFREISYRPFDVRYTCYTGRSRGLYVSPQQKVMSQFIGRDNIGLCANRINRDDAHTFFVTKKITDKSILSSKDNSSAFPLYTYAENLGKLDKTPNLDKTIWDKLNECVGEKVTPENVLDYIYGVLYTPSYRERFKEFLKVNYPRIPYPKNKDVFCRITAIGHQLRELHLMETVPQPLSVAFNISGDNIITARKMRFEDEKVYINTTQYFENVPELAWNFYIGGYQPAQKWLEDRDGRSLTYDDIEHYRQIIAVLVETHRLMLELDGKTP